jgi:hypothetical protein
LSAPAAKLAQARGQECPRYFPLLARFCRKAPNDIVAITFGALVNNSPTIWQALRSLSLRRDLCAVVGAAILLFGTPCLRAQAPAAESKNATITSLRIVQEKDGPAVEILSTKPLTPAIQAIGDPPRLVIDLPNARLERQSRISVQADQINALRANQFQQNPPVARVVVDLQASRAYSWDAAGNRLVVHLGKNPGEASNSPIETPSVPSVTPAAAPPVVTAVRAAGPLAIAGDTEGTGSSITAGPDTAVLSLSSGGEVRICPGTTVAITPSENQHNLLLSMNTGALEAHFALDASADSVMTPDFRIVLAGPGEFHYAVSADSQGNTCVRALPGNTASAMVTELIGNRSYQVKATDQLMFRSGQLDRVDMSVPLECGCPPPRDSILRASNNLPMQAPGASEAQSKAMPQVNTNPAPGGNSAQVTSTPSNVAQGAGAPVSESDTSTELHVQVTAPFVFRATGPPPSSVDVSALPADSRQQESPAVTDPLPPPPDGTAKPDEAGKTPANQGTRGFFRKIGAFFSSLFH